MRRRFGVMVGAAVIGGIACCGGEAHADGPRTSPQWATPGVGGSAQDLGPYGVPAGAPGAMAGGVANGQTGASGPETTNPNAATPPSFADLPTGADAGAGGGAPGTPVAAPFGSQAALASGLGGGLGGSEGALVMLGDRLNVGIAAVANPPTPPTPPIPVPPQSYLGLLAAKAKTNVPYIRALKISENQSPLPQDRLIFGFNYFDNVNGPVNGRFGAPVRGIEVYRYVFGFEKTFLDGNASIGVRDSINTLSSTSPIASLGGTSTAVGDLNVFAKYVIRRTGNLSNGPSLGAGGMGGPFASQGSGSVWTLGVSLDTPTGPGNFAGSRFSTAFRNTQIQPFLGYYYKTGRLYFQGFESISVPFDQRDVLELYSDVGIGYFVYQDNTRGAWLTAIAPTLEAHINIPLTHRDVFNVRDVVGTADTVDLTYGTNFLFGRKSLLTTALTTPVTGPRPFSLEASALFNYYFGARTRAVAPPIVGN